MLLPTPQYEDQFNLIKELQAKTVELQSEQHRGAKAIMDHEPTVNHDPQVAERHKLREQVMLSQIQVLASKSSGRGASSDSNEVNALLNRNRPMQEEINQLTQALQTALDENAYTHTRMPAHTHTHTHLHTPYQ